MKPITAVVLLANRQGQREASFSRVEIRARIERSREAERKASDVLKNAIIAADVTPHAGTSILAAADPLRKAAVIAALAERTEPEPVEGGAS